MQAHMYYFAKDATKTWDLRASRTGTTPSREERLELLFSALSFHLTLAN